MIVTLSLKKIVSTLLLCLLVVAIYATGVEVDQTQPFNLVAFLANNWEAVALIISEVLALSGTKYTGILKLLVGLAGKLLSAAARKSS